MQPTLCLPDNPGALAAFIPQPILKVAEARHLVWSRLAMIQQVVPHYETSNSLLRLAKTVMGRRGAISRVNNTLAQDFESDWAGDAVVE